jgi:ABC-2 type transport system ATP-binding protein
MTVPILSITDASYSYGNRRAVDHVSFDVHRGRVTMLLGPNGAGKTTLFSLIARLLIPTNGDIRIDGESVNEAGSEIMRKLGIVFQQPAVDIDLTVRQNIVYYGRLLGLAPGESVRRMREELTRLGLADRSDEQVRTLNSGHRRRVEIARALMARPPLLLLDEPTVGLDPPARRSLVDFLHRLAVDCRMGLLWATHLIDEVGSEDDVVVIAAGKVVMQGSAREIITHTKAVDLAAAFETLTRTAREEAT